MNDFSRKKKLALTTASSIALQIGTILSGFVLPKLYLSFWGSELNGLVSSITQFLSLISFLDLGVGQVVQSSLYEPLTMNDYSAASAVLASGKKFFRALARIFLVYTIGVACIYPFITANNFGYWYVSSLVLILAINSFAQYYFGVNYQMLLNSDQRGYIQNSIQLATLIINVALCAFLLYMDGGLHIVKLVTAGVYLLRPLFMYFYILKKYPQIDFNVHFDQDPIKQKKDGFAQHLASVVLGNTDVVVLTLFSTLSNVSIYAVYNLVISGVKQLITSAVSGVQAVLGELWAKKSINQLETFFRRVEWTIHNMTVIVFGCTAILVVPFVEVYTAGINDANYIVPTFAYLITLAHACHCLRLPYNCMVLAAGHFRQTKICYYFAAIINIVVSVLMVYHYGLIGVAIGTLVSMLYQTTWLVLYLKKNIFCLKLKFFFKQILSDILIVVISCSITTLIPNNVSSYFEWLVLALKVFSVWFVSFVLINMLLYRSTMISTMHSIGKKIANKRKS